MAKPPDHGAISGAHPFRPRKTGFTPGLRVGYLEGKLQFLFIAPERLSVTGFPEMLAKRKPVLVAVDEAHCISQWGHDFRPDYRMIGQYLPLLRPAAVMALTATATPSVQNDIEKAAWSGSMRPASFKASGAKTLLLKWWKRRLPERLELLRELIADPRRAGPPIIYAPNRKQTETLALDLADLAKPRPAYHAGLSTPPCARKCRTIFWLASWM